MKRFFFTLLMCMMIIIPVNVFAEDYEAKLIIKGTNPDTEINYETVEEAFQAVPIKETEYTTGNVYFVIQLLKDVEVDTTLTAKTTRRNFQLDLNGKNIVSSADPVIELKAAISGITNVSGEACSITQKNVTNVNAASPNTIVLVPQGMMSTMLSATNVTFGDGTGTAVNSSVMMPMSVSGGTYLGKMILAKPMFGAAISGGLFDQDPTAHIDTLAYDAVKNKNGLYEIREYIAARVNIEDETIVEKHGDMQEAIAALEEGQELRLLKQAHPVESVSIKSGEKLAIDFHGEQLLASGCPNSAATINNNVFIKNLGNLTLYSRTTQSSTNFVYDETPTAAFASTIHNKGTLNIKNINVNVNYNQPGRVGPIYTITNDSSDSDAFIYINSVTKVGGLRIEPEDPATGKYPALHMTGSGYKYENVINIEYEGKDDTVTTDNDNVIFMVEDTVVTDIIESDVFDSEGNFNTQMYLTNGIDLQKKNIGVKKDGVAIEFEYNSNTDELTVPAKHFTDEKDNITINYQYEVTYVVDGKVLSVDVVDIGTDSINPEIPAKEGYTAKWDGSGKSIYEDTTITAIYTAVKAEEEEKEEILPPKTGDSIIVWYGLLIGSAITIVGTFLYKKYN